MSTFINLTPHPIAVYRNPNSPRPLMRLAAPEHIDLVPRLATRMRKGPQVGVASIPVMDLIEANPRDIPPPREGVLYICSTLVAMIARRPDVLSPGKPINDSHGKRIGCVGLVRHPAGTNALVAGDREPS